MNKILKVIAIIVIPIAVLAVIFIIIKKSKGEEISLGSIKKDFNSLIGKQETSQQPETSYPSQDGQQGKTIIEQSNDQGKLVVTAATMGGVGAIVGAGAVTAGKVGLTAAAKTAGKIAGKLFLPLTAAMAVWDTKVLMEKRQSQGSLSLGEIAGQYTGLSGLGITGKLPQGIQSFLGWKV